MPEIKTKPNKASVAKFLNSIQDKKQREDAKKIAKLMTVLTKKKPVMWGNAIVGFGTVKYKYSTGREMEWLQMGFVPRKNSLSLYFTCDLNKMANLLEGLGKHKRGVGCLYIKTLDDIKIPVLKRLLKESKKQTV